MVLRVTPQKVRNNTTKTTRFPCPIICSTPSPLEIATILALVTIIDMLFFVLSHI